MMKKFLGALVLTSVLLVGCNNSVEYQIHNIVVQDIRESKIYYQVNDKIQVATLGKYCHELKPKIYKGSVVNTIVAVTETPKGVKKYSIPNDDEVFCK